MVALMNKFDVILADPPWHFSVWNPEKSDRHVSHKYDLMEVEDICALPIDQIAADNCALFLWATWPNLTDALMVIDAWKFDYRTCAWVWVKSKRSGFGFHFGMGYYTRANTEPCLLAVRGRMPVATKDVSALIYYPVKEHSKKPEDQYTKIERLYPDMNYCELFARKKRDDWYSWGNEIESDFDLVTSPGG